VGIKYRVNEAFFEKWSSDMAYVLGYIYADGDLNDSPYMRGKYVSVASVDKSSILRIRGFLNSEHTIKETRSHFIGSKTCYILRIGSHKIYNDLYKLGLYPNKSLTITFPKIPKKYLGHFIRGYFDGDGCIYFEKRKGSKGQQIVGRIRTIFTSGSKIFLEVMNASLDKIGVENGKIYSSKRSYQLVFNNTNSIKIFKLIYKNTGNNSFFMRKFSIFKKYFELRPIHIDKEIKDLLEFHTGHVVK
jgi:hypothetical protein